jgi:hypothetical protein
MKNNQRFLILTAISALLFVAAVLGFFHWRHSGQEETEIEYQLAKIEYDNTLMLHKKNIYQTKYLYSH